MYSDYIFVFLGVNVLVYFRKGNKIIIIMIIIVVIYWGFLYILYFKENYDNSLIVCKFIDEEIEG